MILLKSIIIIFLGKLNPRSSFIYDLKVIGLEFKTTSIQVQIKFILYYLLIYFFLFFHSIKLNSKKHSLSHIYIPRTVVDDCEQGRKIPTFPVKFDRKS